LYMLQYFVLVLCLIIYTKILGKLYLRLELNFISREFLREIIHFGLFIILGIIGVSLCVYMDRIMSSSLKGQADSGVFSIAVIIATLIEIPKRSITQISIPILSKALQENDLPLVRTINRKASLNQLIVGCFLFLGILCNIDGLFGIMANGAHYQAGKYAVLFLGLSKLIDMSTGVNNEIIGYSSYYRVGLPMVFALGGLSFVTNWLLIPPFGVSGAAASTAVSILIFSLIRAVYVWWRFRIVAFTWQTLLVAGIALLTYGIVYFVPSIGSSPTGLIVTMSIRSLVIVVVFGGLVLSLGVSEDINKTFLALWKKYYLSNKS